MKQPTFAALYPNITYWVESFGWIEIGEDEHSSSLVQVLNEGGLVWESDETHKTIDQALSALEEIMEEILKEWA